MTGYVGNGRNIYSGYNPLCDKLRAKYSDSVRRAGNGASRSVSGAPQTRRDAFPAGRVPERANASRTRTSAPRQFAAGTQAAGRPDPGRKASGRRESAQTASDASGYKASRNSANAGTNNAVQRRTDKRDRGSVTLVKHIFGKFADSHIEAKRQKAAEIKLRKKPFPKGALISGVICTVMLLVVVFSYVQVYEMNSTISELKSESAALADEADKLSVELELKDDIRTIERIATEEIGMVKSDRVDTRYISVSGGERIDVIENPEEQSEDVNIFTTLLSAIGENFEKILDRIE